MMTAGALIGAGLGLRSAPSRAAVPAPIGTRAAVGSGARLVITPDDASFTSPISIVASGLGPGEPVRILSKLVDDAAIVWSAVGKYVADAAGVVDVSTAPSEGGTFSGVDPAGLLWSLQPPSGTDRAFMVSATRKPHKLGQPDCDPVKPVRIDLSVESASSGRAQGALTLHRLDPRIEMSPVREGRLRGIAFRWEDRSRRRGAIMSLTGSGDGVEMNYAPALASLGYDVLSLAYFAYGDLPQTVVNIPLEYCEEGFQWMRRELGAKRAAVQGASRGGELTVALASCLPQYVDGAIAIVPMYASSAGWDPNGKDVGCPSWTFEGREIPWAEPQDPVSLDDMRRLAENLPLGYAATPYYRADLDRPEVRAKCAFPIEQTHGHLLMISAVDDQMWPCTWGSNVVVNRLRAKGRRHPYRHLALPDTGHWTPLPNTVTSFTQATYHSLGKVLLACGGTPQGTARSSRTMWDGMVEHYEAVFD